MKHMKHFFVLLFACCAVSASAQVPFGTFSYVFTNAPLWDASGSYSLTGTSNGITDHATFVISNAANGLVTGTTTETINDGSLTVHVASTVTGKISIKAGVAGASLKSSGTLTVSGVDGTAKGKSTVTIDPDALELVAHVTETLTIHGRGSDKFSASATAPLPAGMDGDWALDTDITSTNHNKLAGTGTLTLSNGRALVFALTGSYSPKNGVGKLKLAGAKGSDAGGASLTLTTDGTNMVLTVLKGKVLGQKPAILQ